MKQTGKLYFYFNTFTLMFPCFLFTNQFFSEIKQKGAKHGMVGNLPGTRCKGIQWEQ